MVEHRGIVFAVLLANFAALTSPIEKHCGCYRMWICRHCPGRRELAAWAGLVRALGGQGWPLEAALPAAWEQVFLPSGIPSHAEAPQRRRNQIYRPRSCLHTLRVQNIRTSSNLHFPLLQKQPLPTPRQQRRTLRRCMCAAGGPYLEEQQPCRPTQHTVEMRRCAPHMVWGQSPAAQLYCTDPQPGPTRYVFNSGCAIRAWLG